MKEYYKVYRPKRLEDVVGQEGAVASLQRQIEKRCVPHAILLTGPSGVGKTTIIRILQDELECGDEDFQEHNAADFKGVDDIRMIRRQMNLAPIAGRCRIWFMDEVHKLTGDAQNAFLKMLEDTPSHVYFMLATTDPQKVIKTIHTRCTEVKLSLIGSKELDQLVRFVLAKEKIKLSNDVVAGVVEAAEGSARKALVILHQVALLEDEEAQLAAISSASYDKGAAIDLARALVGRSSWPEVAKLLREIKEEPESVRYCVLGYARAILLGGGKQAQHCAILIDIFARNFYDSKNAGLALACWEAVQGPPKR